MDLSRLESDPVSAVDPNELLNRLREGAAETMRDLADPDVADDGSGGEANLATAFLQLDDWLSRRGFLPQAWQDTTE